MSIRFLSPTAGECLSNRAGAVAEGKLFIRVTLMAEAENLCVCGIPAIREKQFFSVTVPLTKGQNTLTAIAKNGIWHDAETDLFCTKIDALLNSGTPADIRERLDAAYTAFPTRGFFEALMHEQYFYVDYRRYLPDFEARLRVALDFAREHNLIAAFLSELTD